MPDVLLPTGVGRNSSSGKATSIRRLRRVAVVILFLFTDKIGDLAKQPEHLPEVHEH